MDQTVTALQEIFGPLKEIGVVIGEARPLSFVFMIRPELSDTIPVWEYVITPLNKGIVVAQIQNAVSFSSILSKELEFSAASKLISAGIEEFKHLREARVLAYIEDINGFMNNGSSDEVTYRPRYVVHPASPVFLAPKPLLELLYSGKGKTIYVGNLVTRGDVKVHFSIRGFMRHVAIIAQTGAGKSYLVGVIIEELLRTVLSLDWHARIASIDGSRIFINAGRLSGLEKGTILEVFSQGEEIVDSKTKMPLGRTKGTYRGELEVIELFGVDASIAKVRSGSGFTTSDLVYVKKE